MQKFILLIIGILVAIVSYISSLKEDVVKEKIEKQSTFVKEYADLNRSDKKALHKNENLIQIALEHKEDEQNVSLQNNHLDDGVLTELEVFKQRHAKTLTLKKELLTCLKSAQDFRAGEACRARLDKYYKMQMNITDAPEEMMKPPAPPEGMWEEEIKPNMIQAIEQSIEEEESITPCIEDATTQEEIEACFQTLRNEGNT